MDRERVVTDDFELLTTQIPGPHSRDLAASLARLESRGVTHIADDFPIFWESAAGALVTDVDGNRFLDLTSAFGVAVLGHTDPYVAAAIADQAVRLIHGMGDVHPAEVRVRLLEMLNHILPDGLTRTYLCTGGSEAVDYALKTAYLKTGKAGVIAFEGGYHGLTASALSVTGIERFRAPFTPFLAPDVTFAPFPRESASDAGSAAKRAGQQMRDLIARTPNVGAIIIEPIQGRAGVIVPPKGYLKQLRDICTEHGIVLIFDEIYTAFGRTGSMFACEFENVIPDLMCLGKAFANGYPMSAVVGTEETMNAWAASSGEALHTSTYLGNPLGCAAALAHIGELLQKGIVDRARRLGVELANRLDKLKRHSVVVDVRGRGLMWGIELKDAAVAEQLVRTGLRNGVILLQSGLAGNVITIAPPAIMTHQQLMRAIDILETTLVRAVAA